MLERPAMAQDYVCLYLFRSELLSLLKTYNCYHEGRSFQLRHREVCLVSLLYSQATVYPGLLKMGLVYTC